MPFSESRPPVGRMSFREGLEHVGGRTFMRISLGTEIMRTRGWLCFYSVHNALRQWGVRVEDLEHRYTEENYANVIAVWEVMPRVRSGE